MENAPVSAIMTWQVMVHGTPRRHCTRVVNSDPKVEALMNKARWLLPAIASLAFLVFSVVVAAREGLFGFLGEHQRNGWGAQITIDLVTATVVALSFI